VVATLTDDLVGRERELAALSALIDAAGRGCGGSLVVVGTPGMGRSRLLQSVEELARATGMGVWTARAHGSEQAIDGAVVSRLTGDTATAPPTDFADAVAAHAETQPLVVVVDDVHLADDASLLALSYAARRAGAWRAAIVMTAVSGAPALDGPLGGLPVLRLPPLTNDAAAALVIQRAAVTEAVASSLAHIAGGCPLAVLELAGRLSPDQRDGRAPLPALPEPGDALRRSFALALDALPAATRRALCVAAAEPTGDVVAVGRALSRLGDDLAALEPAEESGVVRVDGTRITFDHPVRRLVAYHSLAAPSRRTAHRALALALDDPRDAERRAQHLVAGTAGPDATVAADLELVAHHLETAGRRDAAVEAWLHAARLSATGEDERRRRHEAARLASARTVTLSVLSPAERRVAEAVGRGLSNKQAATELYLSAKTVDAHLGAVYRKLGIATRAELAVIVTREAMETSAAGSGGVP